LKRVSGADTRRTWAQIDLGALRRNLRALRARAPGRRMIAVLKADAYGHGARLVAGALEAEGCEAFAVMTLGEAAELRAAGVRAPILLLEPLLRPQDADVALAQDLAVVVSRPDLVDWLDAAALRAGRDARIHVKLDTGMGRLGLAPADLPVLLERLRRAPRVRLEGACTHLAEADDPRSPVTAQQRARFAELVAVLRGAGFSPSWIHVDNSAGIARGCTPETNAARPGISLWGIDPTREGGHALEPVMSLWTRVCHVKTVAPGTRIGYGGEHVARETERIATLALGYADGLPRAVGGKIEVGWRGKRLPLVGRVSCDLVTAAAPGDAPIEPGEPVLVFGRSPGLDLPVEEVARAAGTIAYEILVRIGPRVPRVPA
jgi:alanine racemase